MKSCSAFSLFVLATLHPTQPQTRIPYAGLPANHTGVLVQGIKYKINAGKRMKSEEGFPRL